MLQCSDLLQSSRFARFLPARDGHQPMQVPGSRRPAKSPMDLNAATIAAGAPLPERFERLDRR
jgi:hypothetical protein